MSLRELTKILIVDNGTHYLEALGRLFAYCDVFISSRATFVPSQAARADVIILSGGHIPVAGNESLYEQEINYIKKATVPILGICLGYEIIAHACGARLELLDSKEAGVITIIPTQENSLFEGVRNFSVYENRRWVVKTLPSGLVGLAESPRGYEIIKHATKPIYGFQFHPELFVHETSGKKIFTNMFNMFKRSEG
ncbi:MAG: gamma-glutamyl-gamma-aminobutyrate hydrolase family protein [Patescibacteria group bacterium]